MCVDAVTEGTSFIGFIATTPAEDIIRFGDTDPWTDARGRILNPPVERIDVSEERAGAIRPAATGDWTVAVRNFPTWNPDGKHPLSGGLGVAQGRGFDIGRIDPVGALGGATQPHGLGSHSGFGDRL